MLNVKAKLSIVFSWNGLAWNNRRAYIACPTSQF